MWVNDRLLTFSLLLRGHDHFFDKDVPSNVRQVMRQLHWSSATLKGALTISLTASLSYLAWLIFRFPYGYWLTVTVLIIMEDSLDKTKNKSVMRFWGQLLAAIYGLLGVYFFAGNVFLIGGALLVGFFISGCIIGSNWPLADVGNHAGSAIAIMLLLGSDGFGDGVVFGRFFNVVAGILLANTVLYYQSKNQSLS